MIDYRAAQFWVDMFVVFVSAVVWLYAWRVRRDMATNEKIAEIETTISAHVGDSSVRLAHMDERMQRAVGHPELRPIYERLNNVSEQISEINGKMHTLDLIHEMLLHGGQ